MRPELDSRALAERLIASGDVLVDGEPRAKSFRLEGGEEIDVEIPEAVELQPQDLDIPIVWVDEHLLIVDKPAGLVVHPAGSTRTGTLVQGLAGDPQLQQRVRLLVVAARNKNIQTVAERVEDANTMAVLWQVGVQYIQGYFVNEPEQVVLRADGGR